jgi:hypothetical protein
VRAANLPVEIAVELIDDDVDEGTVAARIATEVSLAAIIRRREQTVRALCSMAQLPELADGYIAARESVDHVRAQLCLARAVIDESVELDTVLSPDTFTGHRDRR